MSEPSGNADVPAILGGEPVRSTSAPEWPPADPDVYKALERCFADGSWGKYHGQNSERVIEGLRALHGCAHVILCASGTAAIELALRGMKVGKGDEVVLAAYDFKANFTNILTVGATPVLVDVRSDNCQLDVSQLEASIGEKTKAVIASHLHGGVVDIPAVMEIARRHKVPVIEDVCQMPGARIHGKFSGTWGDVGVHSFGGSKLLTAGRGGAIVSDNSEIVQRIRLYTQRGNEAYPLSELQAAVLLPQLEKLEERNSKREKHVGLLREQLKTVDGFRVFENDDSDSQPGYFKVGLQYDPATFAGLSSDIISAAFRAEGVAINPGFRALHCIHSHRRFKTNCELPVATDADSRVLTLHHPVLLEEHSAMEQIAGAVVKIERHARQIAELEKT